MQDIVICLFHHLSLELAIFYKKESNINFSKEFWLFIIGKCCLEVIAVISSGYREIIKMRMLVVLFLSSGNIPKGKGILGAKYGIK